MIFIGGCIVRTQIQDMYDLEAKAKCTAFSRSEWPLIKAVPVSSDEIRRALANSQE